MIVIYGLNVIITENNTYIYINGDSVCFLGISASVCRFKL
jgi:hypothetical protein